MYLPCINEGYYYFDLVLGSTVTVCMKSVYFIKTQNVWERSWMHDKVSLWGLIKQEALRGTAAQHYKSDPASQLSLSLFSSRCLKCSLSHRCLWWGTGSGAPLSDAPGALGGAPDVLLQSCGPQHLWRFFHASNSCSLHLQSVHISNSIWKSASLPFFPPSSPSLGCGINWKCKL